MTWIEKFLQNVQTPSDALLAEQKPVSQTISTTEGNAKKNLGHDLRGGGREGEWSDKIV